jgi:hypothetical protein
MHSRGVRGRAGRTAVVAAVCALIAAGAAFAQSSAEGPAAETLSSGSPTQAEMVSADSGSLLSRHWFKGLLCAGFLLLCALAAPGERARSRRRALRGLRNRG